MRHVDEGLLHAWLDGELAALGPSREAELLRHLAECAECRARLEEERAVRERAYALLRGDPLAVEAPPFETVAARAGLSARRPPRRAALVWAATVVLALGAGWLARSTLQRPEPAGETRTLAVAAREEAPPPVSSAAPSVPAAEAPAAPRPQAPDPTPAPLRVAAREEAAQTEPAAPEPPAPRAAEVPAVAAAPAVSGAAGGRAEPAPAAPRAERVRRRMALRESESARARRTFPDSAPLALEGLVVTGAGTPGAGVPDADGWREVEGGEARRLLRREPLRVRGLPVVDVRAGRVDGREVVRVRQALGGGALLSLVQARDVSPSPPAASAPAPEARDVAPEHTRLVRHVGGVTVTASAPLPADSLGRLLERLR